MGNFKVEMVYRGDPSFQGKRFHGNLRKKQGQNRLSLQDRPI